MGGWVWGSGIRCGWVGMGVGDKVWVGGYGDGGDKVYWVVMGVGG